MPTIIILAGLGLVAFALLALSSYGRLARRAVGPRVCSLPVAADATEIDRVVEPLTRERSGETGLCLISNNPRAFALRAASARHAGRSLDLMYYYWRDDMTGGLLVAELLEAADRGVRVRLLVDDINIKGRDSNYRALDEHPNIEVRLFNPSRNRSDGIRRGVELILRFVRSTRRMHNKAWIADGRVAIVGGRNIGDAYFDAAKGPNFHDMDMLLVGDAVAETETIFDDFWNSEASFPLSLLPKRRRRTLAELRHVAAGRRLRPQAKPFMESLEKLDCACAFAPEDGYRWVREVDVISDPPEKALALGRMQARKENRLAYRIRELVGEAQSEIRIISPYFIPGRGGVGELQRLSENGVDIAVLTNSLAATDVVAVHGAYASYRRSLLKAGVDLYELRPERPRERISLFGSKNASLHTKAFVIDRSLGFVGSFNFDPRSASLNTEMGLFFRDKHLAGQLCRHFEAQIAPDVSYRVTIEGGRLRWFGGRRPVSSAEPAAGWGRRLAAAVIGRLPIESQL